MLVNIAEITQVTDETVADVARLLTQLSPSPPPDSKRLTHIIKAHHTSLLAAYASETGTMVGLLTLVVFQTPTGRKARIEDVVVDESVRGQGIGAALMRNALDRAMAQGCSWVDLTSHPTRNHAHRLYQRLGFTRRDTTVYRCVLNGAGSINPTD